MPSESSEPTESSEPLEPPEAPEPAEPEAAGTVWVTSSDAGKIYEVDATTDTLVTTVDAPDLYPFGVETGFDAAWVINGYGGVTRIDPTTGGTTEIETPSRPTGLVVGDDAVWVATIDGELVSIDPASNEVGLRWRWVRT